MNRLRQCRQQGSALLIVMLVMALMGIVGFAALEAVTRDQRVAGYQTRKKIAFYAAEAGVAKAVHALRVNEDPTFDPGSVGDTTSFPMGLPTYSMDTTSGAAASDLGPGPFPGMMMNLGQNNKPKFLMRYWEARVKGEAHGGSLARIEFAAGTLEANP
jgi:Tfp pilus assembly protein PilX